MLDASRSSNTNAIVFACGFLVVIARAATTCSNNPYFLDAENRTCETLESSYKANGTALKHCEDGTDEYVHVASGNSVYAACCYCSSQSGFNDKLDPSNFIRETDPNVTQCLSYFDWKTSDNLTCPDFDSVTGSKSCRTAGYLEDLTTKTPANQSCCECGGGYQGPLIGKKIRIGYANNGTDDIRHLLNRRDDGRIMGSLGHFARDIFEFLGMGAYPVTSFSKGAIEKYRSTFSQCVEDLSKGNLDICIGSFWDTHSRGNKAIRSNTLVVEEFYLVSRVLDEHFFEGFQSIADPFDKTSWFAIFVILFTFGLSMNVVSKKNVKALGREKLYNPHNFCSSCLDIFYVSLRSLVSGDAGDKVDTPSRSQQCIVIGFTVFSLLIITAYTATAAAFMVLEGSRVEYYNLEDVLEDNATVCCKQAIVEDVEIYYPQLKGQIKGVEWSANQLLNSVIDFEEKNACDLAIISILEYEVSVTRNDTYCDKTALMEDESFKIFIDTVYYVSPRLGDLGEELIYWINTFIDNGKFESSYFERYYTEAKERNFESSDNNLRSRKLESGSGQGTNFSFCPNVDSKDEENTQLTLQELSFPILFSFCCCFIGVCYFYVNRIRKFRNAKEASALLNEMTLDFTSEGVESENFLIRESIHVMDTSSMLLSLENCENIEKSDLENAIDALPDRKMLEELLFATTSSSVALQFAEACKLLSLSEIVNILEESDVFENDELTQKLEYAFNANNPKEEMMNIVFGKKGTKDVVLKMIGKL